MTIHHDKLAYGKLAKNHEEMTEQQILKMLQSVDEDDKDVNKIDKKDCYNLFL